jgi:hypothetical protein
MKSLPVLIFALSLVLFLLNSCKTISQVEEPLQTLDRVMSEEYYAQALDKFEQGDIRGTFELLFKSLDKNPLNENARDSLEELKASLVSESHFIAEPITRGRGMENPINFLLYFTGSDQITPVADMPVRFRFTEGTGILTEEAVTNDAGIAKCYVERIDSFRRGVTIEAAVEFEHHSSTMTMENLNQTYVFSTISLLEQTQRVYVLFENERGELESSQRSELFAHIRKSLAALFHENQFQDVQFHFMTEEILFHRALSLDRSSIDILTDSDILILILVKSAFISQQSVDFYFSSADVLLQVIDTNTLKTPFREEVSKRGAGKSKELSGFQAVVNAVKVLAPELDIYLKELRRLHGV